MSVNFNPFSTYGYYSKMKTDSIIGVVMCGGKSSRMGTDKGLLLKGSQTWALLAHDKLAELNLPVKISINVLQVESYQKFFPKEFLIVDEIDISGPLAGLLCLHQTWPDKDFLILACDMTDIKIETLQHLVNVYQEKKNSYDFFVFRNEETYEPLAGIYCANGLANIAQLHAENKLSRHSMKYVLELGNTFTIPVREENKIEFKNYNQVADLK